MEIWLPFGEELEGALVYYFDFFGEAHGIGDLLRVNDGKLQ